MAAEDGQASVVIVGLLACPSSGKLSSSVAFPLCESNDTYERIGFKDGTQGWVDNPEISDAEVFISWTLQLITMELERAKGAKEHQMFEAQRRIFEVGGCSTALGAYEFSLIVLLLQLLSEDATMSPAARRDVIFHSGTASTLRLTTKIIGSVMSSQSSYSDRTPFHHLHITIPETRPKLPGVQVARTLFEVIAAHQEEPELHQRFTFATPRPERPLSDPTLSPLDSTLEVADKSMVTLEVMADIQLSSRFIHNKGAGVPSVLLLGASCVTEHCEAVTAIGSYTAALLANYSGFPVLVLCRTDSLGAPVDPGLLLRQSDAREIVEGWTTERGPEAAANVEFLAQATAARSPVLQMSNFSYDSVSPDLVTEYLTEVRLGHKSGKRRKMDGAS